MKFARLLSRLALLSLAAAVFAVLAGIYGHSVRPPCQIRSGGPREDIVDPRQRSAGSQNSSGRV